MKTTLLFLALFFLTIPLWAYHPAQDVTPKNQKVCGIQFSLNAEKDNDLLKLTVLIPYAACKDVFFLQQVILEITEGRPGDENFKPLLVCPLANFKGCDFNGKNLELKFNINEDMVKNAYLLLHYGEGEKGISYRVDIKAYLPESY